MAAKKATETMFDGDGSALAGAFGEAARDQYDAALKTFSDAAEKIRTQTEENFASARKGFDAASERMRAVSADALAAAREEMTGAVDFASELARAKTIGDALEIQRGYFTKLFDARVERARAMTEASVEAMRDAVEPFGKSYASVFAIAPAFDKFFPFASK
ncbi:MAG: phasin family protein [Parvularculaceae bacterium]|nr:phasin family protein [Parvularculaceae bacterium]